MKWTFSHLEKDFMNEQFLQRQFIDGPQARVSPSLEER